VYHRIACSTWSFQQEGGVDFQTAFDIVVSKIVQKIIKQKMMSQHTNCQRRGIKNVSFGG